MDGHTHQHIKTNTCSKAMDVKSIPYIEKGFYKKGQKQKGVLTMSRNSTKYTKIIKNKKLS